MVIVNSPWMMVNGEIVSVFHETFYSPLGEGERIFNGRCKIGGWPHNLGLTGKWLCT